MFNLLFPLWFMLGLILSFGKANDAELSRLSVLFALRVRIWLALVWLFLGLKPLVVDGLRSDAEQAALHKADPRNPKTAGKHGAGKAVDMNFLKNGVNVLRKANPRKDWAKVYALAEICGIKNGSLFTGYPDNNHFYID